MTPREILEEFASFRQGVDTYEVYVFLRKDFRGEHFRDFDIEDPRAVAAEARRLESLPREVPVVRQRPSRVPRVTPCEVCGGDVIENLHGGNRARFCGDKCRAAAHYREKVASGKCRRSGCENGAEQGKTYCRPHLDEVAAADRERRRPRLAQLAAAAREKRRRNQSETRKAA